MVVAMADGSPSEVTPARTGAGAATGRVPPGVLVTVAAASVQSGAAVATRLFGRVGPAGAVTLRLVLGAIVLAGLGRPSLRRLSRSDLTVVVTFGVALAAMNFSFYLAIDRIPLGAAVTLEFVGPLGIAVVGSRRKLDVVWAALAAGGVALLAAAPHHLDRTGVLLALVAGACWAAYILLSRETGRRVEGLDGLALAMCVSAIAILPVGVVASGGRIIEPVALGLGVVIAMLSSVLPYSLELVALRRVSARAFGVLLSLDPALAALAGLAFLGQRLAGRELIAIAFVVAANAGSALATTRRSVPAPIE